MATTQRFEQHELTATELYSLYLASIDLTQTKILELGFGRGALTTIIETTRPQAYLGYEIDPSLDAGVRAANFQYHYRDLCDVDYGFLEEDSWALIANPPYSTIAHIREHILNRFPYLKVMMMIPNRLRSEFAAMGFRDALLFDGSQFDPTATGKHIVVQRGLAPLLAFEPDQRVVELQERIIRGASKKKGTSRRVLVLMTNTPQKIPEYQKNFDLYGLEVVATPSDWSFRYLTEILNLDIPNVKITAVAEDSSNLYLPGKTDLAPTKDLQLVDNVAWLRVISKDPQGALSCHRYTHTTHGYIDLTRRRTTEVFGWDDIFVVSDLHKTYHELALENAKISSRDMNISQYIHDWIHYTELVNLSFGEAKSARPVDFANPVLRYVRENRYFLNTMARENGLADFFLHAAASGIFFRASENRRQKNYWWPGLNAGLPFTPKGDPIHEATYMAHDFFHFLIPDLIFTGKTDAFSRRVYITYRMISEAITMVLADMVFAHTLKQNIDNSYDYSKRCLLPLFEATGLACANRSDLKANLRILCHTNVQYCLLGDLKPWQDLVKQCIAGIDAIEKYRLKYMPFFVEDFRWTDANFKSMTTHAPIFSKWWQLCEPMRDLVQLDLQTIPEFIAGLACDKEASREDLVEEVFDRVFARRIEPILKKIDLPRSLDSSSVDALALRKAFVRYMMGQFGLFIRFWYLEESRHHATRLVQYLESELATLSLEKIETVRAYFGAYVDRLAKRNLISLDDARTYKEIYPLFEPMYVFYDEAQNFYRDLADVSRAVLAAQSCLT